MASLIRTRPAETSAASGALALIVAYLLGIRDTELILALGVVIGAIPAAVTWLVDRVRKPAEPKPVPPRNLEF